MATLSMCRICLGQDVRMHYLVNTSLQDTYETLTSMPFERKDGRPLQVCFICYARLQNCNQLRTCCLQSEELFNQMLENNEFKLTQLQEMNMLRTIHLTRLPVDILSLGPMDSGDDIKIERDLEREPAMIMLDVRLREKADEGAADPTKLKHVEENCESTNSNNLETEVKFESNNIFVKELETLQKATADKKLVNKSSEVCDAHDLVIHTGIGQHKHVICEQSASCSTQLSRHTTAIQTSSKPYQCSVCDKCFSSKSHLSLHIRIHTGEKPYNCSSCEKCFNQKSQLSQHMSIHTGEKPYRCGICEKSFRHKSQLSQHIRIHNGEKPYKCDICQKCFNNKGQLAQHTPIHTGEKPYKCVTCNKSFNARSNLSQHISIHTGEKPHKCTMCNKSFYSRSKLSQHMSMHTGEKPYKCSICDKYFNNKSQLSQHIRIHTGEKPYKCGICAKCFTQKNVLSDHVRTHTGEKPYKCGTCRKSFSKKSNLSRHILIHIGEKPDKCDVRE